MRGKYARKTRIVTEEKNIAHVYRYSSAQMTDVLARAKLYPDLQECFTPGLLTEGE
jgi:hypothetical protein